MTFQESRILVTGSAGFIGYHLCKRCLSIGWKVASISTNKPTKSRFLKGVKYFLVDTRMYMS